MSRRAIGLDGDLQRDPQHTATLPNHTTDPPDYFIGPFFLSMQKNYLLSLWNINLCQIFVRLRGGVKSSFL